MSSLFPDRQSAGVELAHQLSTRRAEGLVVVAIPYGGIPVAAAVAQRLFAPLSVCMTTRVTFPQNLKLSAGTISGHGDVYLDPYMMSFLSIPEDTVSAALQTTRAKMLSISRELSPWSAGASLAGKKVLVVDDVIATGLSVLGALQFLQRFKPKSLSVATPVISRYANALLSDRKIDCIAVHVAEESEFKPENYYRDFIGVDPRSSARILARTDLGRRPVAGVNAC